MTNVSANALDKAPKVREGGHMPKVENWISSSDAADLLGIDRSTLHLWAREGKITPLMKLAGLRGAYIFDRAAVERLAAERAS